MDGTRAADDAIELGLAAHGVPVFARRPPSTYRPPRAAELLERCLASGRSRYRMAVIPLILVLRPEEVREVMQELSGNLEAGHRKWLRWLVLAAAYLSEVYRGELAMLLGRDPELPFELLDLRGLPDPEEDHGESGLRALSQEVAAREGAEIDWEGSLEGAVKDLLDTLWTERNARRAPGPHTRAP